jgi:hypothetical protein
MDEQYELLCRHGHEWDEDCYGYDFLREVRKQTAIGRFDEACYLCQTIGEVVTAELMSGFIARLKPTLGAQNAEMLEQLKDVNNVRPDLAALDWISWEGHDRFDQQQKKWVYDALIASLRAVLESSLAQQWNQIHHNVIVAGDLTDHLRNLLAAIDHKSFDDLKGVLRFVRRVQTILPPNGDVYAQGAKSELASRPQVRFVLYGHTHTAKQVVFEGTRDGAARRYINTGTYLPVIETAEVAGFARSTRLAMTFLYGPDEDVDRKKGRTVSLESWTGMKQKQYRV